MEYPMNHFLTILAKHFAAYTKNRRERGFTLIEMMAVVSLLALLAAPQVSNFLIERKNAQASVAATTLNMLATKVGEFQNNNNGACPNTQDGGSTTSTVTKLSMVGGSSGNPNIFGPTYGYEYLGSTPTGSAGGVVSR